MCAVPSVHAYMCVHVHTCACMCDYSGENLWEERTINYHAAWISSLGPIYHLRCVSRSEVLHVSTLDEPGFLTYRARAVNIG